MTANHPTSIVDRQKLGELYIAYSTFAQIKANMDKHYPPESNNDPNAPKPNSFEMMAEYMALLQFIQRTDTFLRSLDPEELVLLGKLTNEDSNGM